MAQKTAMMELKETIKSMIQNGGTEDDLPSVISHIDKLLEKEKEQIMKSMGDAVSKADMTNNRGFLDCEKLFNETYKQD